MIALSSAPVRFTPPWQLDAAGGLLPSAVVFLIRPAGIIDRGLFEADLASPPHNAGRVFPWDMADAAMDAARALLDGEQLGQVLEALSGLKARLTLDGLDPAQRQLIAAIDPVLVEHWPDYAALRRREALRAELLPILAAKRFLAGWEGRDVPFETGKDGLATDATLMTLPLFELRAIGQHAYNLMYADTARPFSPPPSKSGQALPTSPAAKPRPSVVKGGKSATVSGRKTRG